LKEETNGEMEEDYLVDKVRNPARLNRAISR
jgi:hypothetical protein